MPRLDSQHRLSLVNALVQLSIVQTVEGRNILLVDLPPTLRTSITRHGNVRADLVSIVTAADEWGGEALESLIDAAASYADGSTIGQELHNIVGWLASTSSQVSSESDAVTHVNQLTDPEDVSSISNARKLTYHRRKAREIEVLIRVAGLAMVLIILIALSAWLMPVVQVTLYGRGLEIVDGIQLSPLSERTTPNRVVVELGQPITTTFYLRNGDFEARVIKRLGVGFFGPKKCEWGSSLPTEPTVYARTVTDLVLAPKQIYTYTQPIVFTAAGVYYWSVRTDQYGVPYDGITEFIVSDPLAGIPTPLACK
jgi:hypothetical protein